MEKADNVYIIPSSFGWSDLGTWNSAYENMEKDEAHNAISGNNTMLIDASGNMVHVDKDKLIVLQGISNYIVIDTGDVLLICSREKEQEIKEYVAEIKRSKGDRFL
jgi:mannose-1-phosphate guanylyltransferase